MEPGLFFITGPPYHIYEEPESSGSFYYLTRRLLRSRKSKYAAACLWIPYYVLATSAFALLLPLSDPQEQPLPAAGLIIIA